MYSCICQEKFFVDGNVMVLRVHYESLVLTPTLYTAGDVRLRQYSHIELLEYWMIDLRLIHEF